ncbi:MAG: 50S ribosome-binding GTPase [Methanosarcina barkeri]|nr:50S ribosome-binding GTPase [Methanosarcina sp. ERenArc_MAG2]
MISKSPTVGIVGCFQNGKSTLVNCLLDDKVAMTGDGSATTHLSTVYGWGEVQDAKGVCVTTGIRHAIPFHDYVEGRNLPDLKLSHFEVNLWKPLLQHVNVVDTPGFENCDEDNETAIRSLEGTDFVIFVVSNKALSQVEIGLLKTIAQRNLPFTVLMNCKSISKGLWEPLSQANQRICQQIESSLKAAGHPPYPINGQYVWPANLAWFWYATQHMHGNNLNEAEEDLFNNVQSFMSKSLNLSSYDYSTLLEKSNFLPFRKTIQRITTHYGYLNSDSGKLALSYVKMAETALDNGELDKAMIAAERACYVAPGFKPSLQSRAVVCFERKEYDETINSTTSMLEIDARDIETLFLRAKAYFEMKDYELAKRDLCCITELLESEWHIVWEDSDKVIQATKLIDAYMMKMECEQRAGDSVTALETLRHIIKCEQKPLDNDIDLSLELTVLSLLATIEFDRGDKEEARDAAAQALRLLHGQKDVPNIERLLGLYHLFGLVNASNEDSLHKNASEIIVQLLRVLWKSCLFLADNDIKHATMDFTERMSHFPPQSVWMEETEFVPYFISYMGRKDDSIDVESYVKQYFYLTNDMDLSSFIFKASDCLSGKPKEALIDAVKLKCKVKINTILNMNSIEFFNYGYPVLSEIDVTVKYKANDVLKSKIFSERNKFIPNGTSIKWTNVFDGKSMFGSFFGGNKIADIEITLVSSKQGIIDDVKIEK